MSCRTVLPATLLTDLLGLRVPLIARGPDATGAVQGVVADAQAAPAWAPSPALRWGESGKAALPGSLVPAASARAALQAQEAGAAAVVVPVAWLQTALAVLSIPVVADGIVDGRGLVQVLDQGAHGACLAPDAQPLAQVLAEAHRLWPIFAAASAELASPVCYAPEFERERTAPLVARLNAVLAEERTLARAAVHVPQLPPEWLRTTIAACAALRHSVRDLEAVACTRTLDGYATVLAAPAGERLALWQAGWQQVQRQWEKLAQSVFPQLDNASVLEEVFAHRTAVQAQA